MPCSSIKFKLTSFIIGLQLWLNKCHHFYARRFIKRTAHSYCTLYWPEIDQNNAIQWHYFTVTELLSLPFTQRYDLGFVLFDTDEMQNISDVQKSQLLVKLRDLLTKRIVVVSKRSDEQLLRSLGFTQLIDKTSHDSDFALWQFNILTYKHVPDWFNSKFWANLKTGINSAGKGP